MQSLCQRRMKPLNLAKLRALEKLKRNGEEQKVKKSDKGKKSVEDKLPKGFFDWYY